MKENDGKTDLCESGCFNPACSCNNFKKKELHFMDNFIQILTDPENQPHQYVGDARGLKAALTASRPDDAALKSPPECEIEETQEQKRLKWNIKVIPECLDAIERKEGRAREIAQIQFCVIHGDNIREICNAALPHCPDGFALIKLGRFKPTPFSPVTYVTKTHPDTIRVDCVGEKNSYSFALPIAAAEGK